MCESQGGYFLPNSYSLNIPGLLSVSRTSLRTSDGVSEAKANTLLFPGNSLVFDSLAAGSNRPKTTIQIIVETNSRIFCFSESISSRSGLRSFLYETSTPNFLLVPKSREIFKDLLRDYSAGTDSFLIPHSLKYFMLFPELQLPRRTLPHVLTMRPFVVQILPVLRVPDFICSTICANLSILCVLFERVIYVWIGSDISKQTWMSVVGTEKSPRSTSFEIVDVPEEFTSDLWVCIRSIRKLLLPYRVPVIVVPSESGKRPELLQILDCDRTVKENMLLLRFSEIGRAILLSL
jgi:hypothetical protein